MVLIDPKIDRILTTVMDIVIKMFGNLEGKIRQAHQYGLDSLLYPIIIYFSQKIDF